MLMLINPFGTLFDGEDTYYEGSTLSSAYKYHILDTDDLLVETVHVQDIVVALEAGVQIEGIARTIDTNMPYIVTRWFDFSEIGVVHCLNEKVIFNYDKLYINGKELVFNIVDDSNSESGKCYLEVNDSIVCTWFDGTHSVLSEIEWVYSSVNELEGWDFGYCFIVGDYLVIRLRAVFSEIGVIVFTLIYSMDVDLIDVLITYNHRTESTRSKDPSFSSKFVALYNERY